MNAKQRSWIELLELNLLNAALGFSSHLQATLLALSPSEIQVANLISLGKTTKEMAKLLSLSVKTIEFHRDNIRKKLGITR